MLKRLVSSLVGVACLVSMTGAFAASYTGTTTEYDVSGKIRVKSSISGTAGDTVTYLVHDKDATVATLQDNQVVYVDQYELVDEDNGTYTFNYLTDTTNINAIVLLGGDIEDAVVNDTVGAKVTVNGSDVYIADAAGSAGYVLVPCDVVGKNVSEVTLGGVALDDGDWFAATEGLYITGLALNGTDVVAFTAGEAEVASVATLDAAYLSADKADATDFAAGETATDSILAVGKVTGTVAEFGIVINYGDGQTASLKALGKNASGAYAVRVYTDDFASESGVTVQAYYKVSADAAPVLGDAIPVK